MTAAALMLLTTAPLWAAEPETPPEEPFVVPKGELRTELYGVGMDRLGLESDPGTLGFQVSRARVGFTVNLAERAQAVVVFDLRMNAGTTTATVPSTGEGIVIDAYPGDWDAHLPFAFIEGTQTALGLDHRLRAGVQKVLFGFRPKYDWKGHFYLAHPAAFKDLGRRSGVVPSFDLGLTYTVSNSLGSLDAQVFNGTGWRSLEQDLGKDLLLRLAARPIEPLQVVATGVTRFHTDGSTSFTWQAGAQLDWEPVRVLAEGIGGRTLAEDGPSGLLGGAVAVSGDVPLAGVDFVEVLTPTVSLQTFDGDTTSTGDAWVALQAGVTAYYTPNPGLQAWTGVAWETMTWPQGTAAPVHTASLTIGMRH